MQLNRLGILLKFSVLMAMAPLSFVGVDKSAGLRVMSYNIKAGQENSMAHIAEVIKKADPDIVGLQEVDVHWGKRSNYRDEVCYLANALNMHAFFGEIYMLAPEKGHREKRKYGVAFLSKYPIKKSENHSITRLSSLNDHSVPRLMPGFPEIMVEVAGRTIHLFNTHLDYRGDPSVRRQQVRDMLPLLNSGQEPTVLMGDFNAERCDPEIGKLFEVMEESWKNKEEPKRTFPAENPEKGIDFILHSPHFKVRTVNIPDTRASDHCPLVANLVWK